MKKSVLLSIGIICLGMVTYKVNGQNLNPLNVTNIMPPSPEVSAMAKYITMPVSYSTGVPEIGVPLYTVQSGTLSLPLSLSYNASGIKVEEVPTWVGLGWSLSAGGSVSRVVRGLPDDYSTTWGYMYTSKTVKYVLGLPDSATKQDIMESDIYGNYLDIEPDTYFFSIMGYSGKFYYDQTKQDFVQTPRQDIRIAYSVDGSSKINGWVITLPNGIKCYFGQSSDGTRSVTEDLLSQASVNVGLTITTGPANSSPYYTSSWPVMEIVSPLFKTMDFYYTTLQETNSGRSGEMKDYKGNSGCTAATDQENASFYKNAFNKPYLEKISTDLSDVYFIKGTESRLDMATDSRKLDSVIVKNKAGKTIKDFLFNYGYFQSVDATYIPGLDSSIAKKRLYLKSLIESDSGAAVQLPYVFSYDSSHLLPSRLSASQDYWGYYNGKSNGFFLTPSIRTSSIYGSGTGYRAGADRTTDPVYETACILNKVQYPTGGFTEYTYEPNNTTAAAGVYFTDYQLSNIRSGVFQIVNNPFILHSGEYIDSFEVKNIYDQVHLTSSCQGCSDVFTIDCPLHGVIKGITDTSFSLDVKRNDDYILDLPNGWYKAIVDIVPTGTYPDPAFNILLSWKEQIDPYNIMVGGLRVKKIVSSDILGNKIAKSYSYNLFSNSNVSSGSLYSLPVSVYKAFCPDYPNPQSVPSVTKVVSNSAMPLASNDGKMIVYTNVTEYADENNASQKTEYTFSTTPGFLSAMNSQYPFPSNIESDWRSGLLVEKKDFEQVAHGTYRVLTDEQHFFSDFDRRTIDTFGFKFIRIVNSGNYPALPIPGYFVTPYSFASEWYLPDSSYSVQYSYPPISGPASIIEQDSKNYYDSHIISGESHYLLANTKSVNSKGETLHTKTWYPYDYNDISGYNISSLISNGITALPVKEEISKNGKILAGRIVKYNTQGQPLDIYAYENAALSDTVSHDRNTMLESNYNLKTSVHYNPSYNTRQVNNTSDIITSFLWDQTESYPVAKIINADSASVAFTGFEDNGNGNWFVTDTSRNRIYSITGRQSYTLTGSNNITGSVASGKKYILSYWSRNGAVSISTNNGSAALTLTGLVKDGWTYYEHELSNTTSSVTVSGSSKTIDELRLYPKDAQMVTYAYTPLIGINSICTENNSIAYYEYDSFNRLKIIRDADKNIAKLIDYQYQSRAAPYYNRADTGSFTRNNCGSGYIGSAVTYPVADSVYESAISQAAADSLAQNDVTANGQGYANVHGTCTFVYYNVIKTGSYTRDNCATGYVGTTVIDTVTAGTYSSVISQAVADSLAQNDLDSHGQINANVFGTCTVAECTDCTAPNRRCITGICSRGFVVYTVSDYNSFTGKYDCAYHYEWPDGAWSPDFFQESDSPCL